MGLIKELLIMAEEGDDEALQTAVKLGYKPSMLEEPSQEELDKIAREAEDAEWQAFIESMPEYRRGC